ncbi:MAG: epoxide hydrolase family protein [Acidimicrobiales bacterium]
MKTQPFSIDVPQAVLDDLHRRLAATRFADSVAEAGWDYGTNADYLRDLVEHWRDSYDWRKAEARLNELAQFRADIGDTGVHFVHEQSADPGATPLLLLHGWPSSFVQMEQIIPMLTDTSAPGAAFHAVVPSLPGYGFSDRPAQRGMSVGKIGELFHDLMTGLGYDRYAIRATDLGAGVATQMAIAQPAAVVAIHTSGTNPFLMDVPSDLTAAEQEFVANAQRWMQTEMAYAQMHSSKPQTVAAALNDSPAGLASWIVEKFWRWTDHDGDLETAVSRDDLLTNLTIYWVTETINSSMRLYYETARDPGSWGAVMAPSARLQFSGDMFATPREWVERSGPVTRWTEAGRGGHFPEWEKPDIVAADLREFVATLH